jgi:hypothetical protein
VADGREVHGFAVWFDCETAAGITFSNAPGAGGPSVFGQAFFPWPRPVVLTAGDDVSVDIRADAVGEDYVFTWRTAIRAAADARLVETFEQSQFASAPLSRDWLRKTASTFLPSPNDDAVIDSFVLAQLCSGTRLDEIAEATAARFPQRFPDRRSALTRVGRLSMRYSR